VIPSEVGTITLPEVSVRWWDTNSKSEKTATIPARTLTVIAGEKSVSVSQDHEKIGPVAKSVKPADTNELIYWQSATLVFLLLWLSSSLSHARSRRSQSVPQKNNKASPTKRLLTESQSALQKGLLNALKNGSLAEVESLLLKWSSSIARDDFHSLGQLAGRLENEAITRKIQNLDANRYSNNHLNESCAIDKSDLLIIEQTLTQSSQDSSPEAIPPLYPSRGNQ